MRDLSLVRVLPDGDLLFSTAGGPRTEHFRLPVDSRLRAALAAGPAADQLQIQLSSALTPREIQARFRAGQPAEEIARAAGVPVERVRRFEPPIRAERDRVAGQARHAVVSDAADLYTGQPLGALVDEQLRGAGARGAGDPPQSWDAWRRQDGRWVVELTWGTRARGSAQWLWDPVRLRLTALSAAAEDFSRGRGGGGTPSRGQEPVSRGATGPEPAPGSGSGSGQATAASVPMSLPAVPPGAGPGPAPAVPAPVTPREVRPAVRTRPDGSRRSSVPAWSDVLLGTSPRGLGTPADDQPATRR